MKRISLLFLLVLGCVAHAASPTFDSVTLTGTAGNVVTKSGTQTLSHKTFDSPVINSPTGLSKSDVGLANVDNTSDANKPVSTATQTALDGKVSATNGTAVSLSLQGLTPISSGTFYSRSGLLFSGTSDRQTLGLGIVSPFDNTTYSGTSDQPNWSVSFFGNNVKHDPSTNNGWSYIDPSYPHNCFIEQENRWTVGGHEQNELGWFIDNDSFRVFGAFYCIETGTGSFSVNVPQYIQASTLSDHYAAQEVKYSGTDTAPRGILLTRGTNASNLSIMWNSQDNDNWQELRFAPRNLKQSEFYWTTGFGNVLTYGTSGNYVFGQVDTSAAGWEADNLARDMIYVRQRTGLSGTVGGLRWDFGNAAQTGDLFQFVTTAGTMGRLTYSGSASFQGLGVSNKLRLEPAYNILRVGTVANAADGDTQGPGVVLGSAATQGAYLLGEGNAKLQIYRGATTGNQSDTAQIILSSSNNGAYGVGLRREGVALDLTDTGVAPVYAAPFARLARAAGFLRGTMLFGGTTTQTTSQVWIQTDATNKPCLILNGTSGQTADVQTWMVNSGTVARVTPTGLVVGGSGSTLQLLSSGTAALTITAISAGSTANYDIAVTGATTGDGRGVHVTFSGDLPTDVKLHQAYVLSTGTARVVLWNPNLLSSSGTGAVGATVEVTSY